MVTGFGIGQKDQREGFSFDRDEASETCLFRCPGPGGFRCTSTRLVFVVDQEVELLYRTVQWDVSLLQSAGKTPAGPLFNIQCPESAVYKLHLPHCATKDALQFEGLLSVVHITDDGMSVLEITDSHVVVKVPHLSAFGLVWDIIKWFLNITLPVEGQVLLFLRPPGSGPTGTPSAPAQSDQDAKMKIDLKNILDDLRDEDFKNFKWFLKCETVNNIPPIEERQLSKAERQDTVDLMVQKYGLVGAVGVMERALTNISRNDLGKQLPAIDSGTEVRQVSVFLRCRPLKTRLPSASSPSTPPPPLPPPPLLPLLVSGSGSRNVGVFLEKVWTSETVWERRNKQRRNMTVLCCLC
ncbi:NACHT, LRR and PYD domains-containing protein 1-like protein [Lates japonicus]|uniref:NACHT, LRR and PYD domains-containing protein 1-like protein n=1 Tax=Lates japonicus TaxID=270547 RepID=A0AAD3N972_LATJO|nr:NACHT, LRR and PYD domains-containing protein 1-like protein [Lates japonicus]